LIPQTLSDRSIKGCHQGFGGLESRTARAKEEPEVEPEAKRPVPATTTQGVLADAAELSAFCQKLASLDEEGGRDDLLITESAVLQDEAQGGCFGCGASPDCFSKVRRESKQLRFVGRVSLSPGLLSL